MRIAIKRQKMIMKYHIIFCLFYIETQGRKEWKKISKNMEI